MANGTKHTVYRSNTGYAVKVEGDDGIVGFNTFVPEEETPPNLETQLLAKIKHLEHELADQKMLFDKERAAMKTKFGQDLYTIQNELSEVKNNLIRTNETNKILAAKIAEMESYGKTLATLPVGQQVVLNRNISWSIYAPDLFDQLKPLLNAKCHGTVVELIEVENDTHYRVSWHLTGRTKTLPQELLDAVWYRVELSAVVEAQRRHLTEEREWYSQYKNDDAQDPFPWRIEKPWVAQWLSKVSLIEASMEVSDPEEDDNGGT